MAEISKITLPSGTTYDLKDATARDLIDEMSGYTNFLGVTTTALTDGATTNPITIGGASVTAKKGDIATYGSAEFIFNGTAWQAFGDLSGLGALAYKDSASASYTPAGSVSQPTFTGTAKYLGVSVGTASKSMTGNFTPAGTVDAPTISVKTAGSTTTVKNPTSKTVVTDMSVSAPASGTATGELVYCSVSNETLSLSKFVESTGASITTSNVTVKNGDAAYEATAPTFTGTQGSVSVSGTIANSASLATYTSTATGRVDITPAGTVSKPTFTGTQATITSD